MTVKERIGIALDRAGKSQRDLAKVMGLASASVSAMLSKDDIDSIKYLKAIEELTGYTFEWLRTGDGPETKKEASKALIDDLIRMGEFDVKENTAQYLKGSIIRPITVTVDRTGRELITLVNVKARAGYARGYGDAGYIEKLPAFSLPMLKEGSYRMFEVDGDSMQQLGGGGLRNGDIVIAQYVEDIFSIKDNRVYVVVTVHGVVVKRCLNNLKLKDNPTLICKSDNKDGNHENIVYRPHEIREVWELKAFISRQLGFATDIWDVLKEMETKMALMDEKIKRISDEKRLAP